MKKHSKLTLITIISLILLLVVAIPLHLGLSNVSASTSYPYKTSLITNGTFSSYSGSNQPYIPGIWSIFDPNGESEVISGVISTKSTAWDAEALGLENEDNPGQVYADPSSAEYLNLFVNAESDSIYYGYKSNTFILAANSYYEISVYSTVVNGAHASVIVNGLSETAELTNISSNNWSEYTIFIQTGDSSESVSLELMLGNSEANSTGAVFFNSAIIWQHTATSYDAQCPDNSTSTQLVVDLKNEADTTYKPFTNSGFDENNQEEGLLNWDIETAAPGTTYSDITVDLANTTNYNSIKSPNLVNNTNILYLENSGDGWQKITGATFTIPVNNFLKLSFWARASVAGGTLDIISTDDESLASVSIETNDGSDVNNDWTRYTIVIEGGVSPNDVYIELNFGTEDSTLTGYMGLDNVTLEKITYDKYCDGGDEEFSLKAEGRTNNSAVLNGTFSKTENEDYNATPPLSPYNWTYYASDDREELDGTHGIINTNSNLFTNPLGHTMTNPSTFMGDISEVYNNVLMINNESQDTQYYKTASALTLSADTYYEFSFYINSTCLVSVSGAYIKLYSSTANYFHIKNVDTSSDWSKYTVYIYTGDNSLTCNVEVGMVNSGLVFFDNILIKESTEDIFLATTANEQTYIVDLKNDNFSVYEINAKDETSDSLYEASTWTATVNGGATPTYGVLNLDSSSATLKENLGLGTLAEVNSKNIFIIKTNLDTYFSAISENQISLAANSYYKITINLLTKNLSSISESLEYGAFVGLTNFDDILSNIDTDEEYQNIVIYVTSDSDKTTAVTFGLGQNNAICSGTVLCDSITVEESDENTYTAALEDGNTLKLQSVTEEEDADDSINETTEEETNSFNLSNLWAIVPSAIFAIMIIVVLVVSLLRKSKLTKAIKNKALKSRANSETKAKKVTYDRNHTTQNKTLLSVRDRITSYEKEIASTKTKMAELEGELGELETRHQENLEKIKEAHRKEIKDRKENLSKMIEIKENFEKEFKEKDHTPKELKELNKKLSDDKKKIATEKKVIENSIPNTKAEKADYLKKKSEIHSQVTVLKNKVENITNEISKLNDQLKNR